MQETLMSKLLDGQEKMIEKLATVSEIVRRHDDVTFPEIKETIKNISQATMRMESKQNEDMERFVQEKNRLYTEFKESKDDHDRRLKTLEADKQAKENSKKEVNTKVRGIVWVAVEKFVWIIIGGIVTVSIALKNKL